MSWDSFLNNNLELPGLGFSIDLSKVGLTDAYKRSMEPAFEKAFADMKALESGAIANPDENRMVGHYWLRNAPLAPTPEIRNAIGETIERIKVFADDVHAGRIAGPNRPFHNLLCIGIGGSALGPQFVAQALGYPDRDPMDLFFFDNTDPDGFEKVLSQIEGELPETLVIVTSKSGGTPETRNGMVEARIAFERAGLDFGKHAVAVTGEGSKLDQIAINDNWLARFPMWDWVGGRTSELAAVGLLPAALSGFAIEGMLEGARAMDEATRVDELEANPAALLALAWHFLTNGKGEKDMVVLPYKDRLELFSRYLQQLVMESIGKERDLDGNVVHQGIAVYGNKGSTDQHAYVQQLREGTENFFALFIEVLTDRFSPDAPLVDGEFTSGDYLHGFFLGTRNALAENGRPSITLTIDSVTAVTVGMLIALFERATGLYASLVNINAYHQPGVEAGKKAAAKTLEIRRNILACMRQNSGKALTAEVIAQKINLVSDIETIYKICDHLACNDSYPVEKARGTGPASHTFRIA